MNSVNLIGRLTRDVDLKYIAGNGTAVGNFSIAVDRPFAKEGQVKVDFFNIVTWGKIAENCANYLGKGSQVAVQGRLQNDTYETQAGEKRTVTKVVAERVEFLSKNQNTQQSGFEMIDDEDVPF